MVSPYIYQTIHTLDGRALWLANHISVLDHASRILYDRPFVPDLKSLQLQIANLVAADVKRTNHSLFVRMLLHSDGRLVLEHAGVSLYRGYALRSLSPDAISLRYDLPFGELPSSVCESAAQFALTQAALRGVRSVVRCNADGVVLSCDGAPLYCVKADVVYTSPATVSVERIVAARSIADGGLTLVEEVVMQDDLIRFDELFAFDYRGITSLSRCDNQPYMSLMTERVARAAEQIRR